MNIFTKTLLGLEHTITQDELADAVEFFPQVAEAIYNAGVTVDDVSSVAMSMQDIENA